MKYIIYYTCLIFYYLNEYIEWKALSAIGTIISTFIAIYLSSPANEIRRKNSKFRKMIKEKIYDPVLSRYITYNRAGNNHTLRQSFAWNGHNNFGKMIYETSCADHSLHKEEMDFLKFLKNENIIEYFESSERLLMPDYRIIGFRYEYVPSEKTWDRIEKQYAKYHSKNELTLITEKHKKKWEQEEKLQKRRNFLKNILHINKIINFFK